MNNCKFCGRLINDNMEICDTCATEAQEIIDNDTKVSLINTKYAICNLLQRVNSIAIIISLTVLFFTLKYSWSDTIGIIAMIATPMFALLLIITFFCKLHYQKKIIKATEDEMHKRHNR